MTAGGTRSSRLGPAARALVLGSIGLGCGLFVLIATFAGLSDGHRAADSLATRSLPAAIALRDLSVESVRAQENFLTAVHTSDPATRAVALDAALDAGRAQDEAWRTYESVAVESPGEQALQRRFEASLVRARQLATAVVSSEPDDANRAELLAEEQAEDAIQRSAVHALETEIYLPMAQRDAAAATAGIDTGRTVVGASTGIGAVLFSLVGIVLMRGARRDHRLRTAESAAMRQAAETATFERSLQAGLEMATTEDASMGVVEQALSMAAPEVPAEVLLADSSRAHFRQVLGTGTGEEHRCRVSSPGECPAIASGQTRLFENSADLDSCPFLREQNEHAWAVCVPVSVAGRNTGVIRAQQALQAPRTEHLVSRLELVARKTGDRIGALRVLAKTRAQAQADPLTGLPNRRTLEQQVRDLQVVDGPYVIAFADLDLFKAINDLHGHETGDRALRLFSRILRDGIRPRDLLARYGGEEFVVVLPDCSIPDARVVAERIRSALASALGNATVPAFTVTIGLAAAEPGDELAGVVARADEAMMTAKRDGRDRVFAAGDERATPERPGSPVAATVN